MLFHAVIVLLGLVYAAAARSPLHAGKRDIPESAFKRPLNGRPTPRDAELPSRDVSTTTSAGPLDYCKLGTTIIPQNANTTIYAVNGTGLPDVPFDIGESYAGLMPISDAANETRQLYFWFFPSSNPLAKDEITIWLNGGPGCSSLEGFFQENGPVIWQYGTYAPVKNPVCLVRVFKTCRKLTCVVYMGKLNQYGLG